MPLAPISYGPDVAPDDQGVNAMREAVAQHQAVFKEVEAIGQHVAGGAQAVTQGILLTQAAKATAAVKKKQADILKFIDEHPYVTKRELQQMMRPEDYETWHAGLAPEHQKSDEVPMFTVAGELFDSTAQQTREEAGNTISLPGWRERWDATEQTESSVIRERYVNRIAADQMIGHHRAEDLFTIDKMRESAVSPRDLQTAATFAQNSKWLKPAERRYKMEQALADMDSFAAENFMRARDLGGMEQELEKLRGPDAAKEYPNLTEKARRTLADNLMREYNHAGVDKVASDIVDRNTTSFGNVDSTGILRELQEYKGPNRAGVLKAVNQQEQEARLLWERKATQMQNSVRDVGTDPQTREFSLDRAQKDPAVRRTLDLLQKTEPKLVGQLYLEDFQNDRRDLAQTNAEAKRAALDLKQEKTRASGENFFAAKEYLSNESNMAELSKLTPSQWASRLADQRIFPGGWMDQDKRKALDLFTAFQKKGAAYVQQARTTVKDELESAFRDDVDSRDLYSDALRTKAHAFLMENAGMDPLKLDDAVHKYVHDELVQGVVQGKKWHWDESGVRRIDWENDPEKSMRPFIMPDGTVIKPRKSEVTYEVTKVDGSKVNVSAGDAIDLVGEGGNLTGTTLPDGRKVDTSATMNIPDIAPLVPDEKTREENRKKATPGQLEAVEWLKANKDDPIAPSVRAILLKAGLL